MPDAVEEQPHARKRLLLTAKAAVEEALADLDEQHRELFGTDRAYTTGDRILQGNYWGKRGATRKRLAEVQFLLESGDWRATLQAAQADYEQGLEASYKDHWILGQFVVLRSVLASAARVTLSDNDDRWDETCRAVRLGLRSGNAHERMWALSSLVDLQLVALREQWPLEGISSTNVVDDLKEMVSVVGGPNHCEALWPTFRQFWRWSYWWIDPAWDTAAKDGYDYLYQLVRPLLPSKIETTE